MERKKILLIEDEVKLARFVELELKYDAPGQTGPHPRPAGGGTTNTRPPILF